MGAQAFEFDLSGPARPASRSQPRHFLARAGPLTTLLARAVLLGEQIVSFRIMRNLTGPKP